MINLPRKKQICILVNKMDCDTADYKQEEFNEISNKMASWREHPQPAENLVAKTRMTENGDDVEGCKYSQLHMSVKHDHEHERTEHKMSPLQPTYRRAGAESLWALWHNGGSRQGHPRYTSASTEESHGWPDTSSTRRPPTNDNTTKTRS